MTLSEIPLNHFKINISQNIPEIHQFTTIHNIENLPFLQIVNILPNIAGR